MIYVPDYNDYNCAYISNSNTIRVYDTVPTPGQTIFYRDYYTDNHYFYRDGSTTFNNYSTLPTCLLNEEVTTSFYYRTDFADIVIVSFIFCFVGVYFVKSLFNALFKNTKRWL